MAAIGWNPQQIAKWLQIPPRDAVVRKRLLSFCDVIGGHEAAGYSPLLQVYGENAELVVAAIWLDEVRRLVREVCIYGNLLELTLC